MIAYRLLRAVGRIALRWYYRRIEVLDADRIPPRGPVLLASNHPNALVDALVIGCSLERPVTLTAKATLLNHPATRALFRIVGVVPLHRASDARASEQGPALASPDPARNARAFTAVLDTLERRGMVLLFPEGRSHSEPALAPLKTGLARIALMARDERHLDSVPIIPIGLMFEQKWAPRTRVVMQVGTPIDMEDSLGTPDAVIQLTRRIDTGLRAVTLNFRSIAEGERIFRLARMLAALFGPFRSLHDPDPPLADAVALARRVFDIADRAPRFSLDLSRRVAHFLERFDALENTLDTNQIPVSDVRMDTGAGPAAWFAIRELAIAIIAGPFALWGRVNHWMPLRLARFLGQRSSRTPDEPAMRTIVLGFILVLSFYAVQTLVVTWVFGWLVGLVYLSTLAPSATWDLRYADRLRRARVRIGVFQRFRRHPTLQQELLGEARWIRTEAQAIDSMAGEFGAAVGASDHLDRSV